MAQSDFIICEKISHEYLHIPSGNQTWLAGKSTICHVENYRRLPPL